MNHLGPQSDEELVLLAQKGSEVHFEALVDRHTPSVYRLALGITGDRMEAEEVVQETFLRAFKHLGRFSPSKASFKTWLLAIARNQSINVFKSLKRKATRFLSDSDPDDHDPGPDNPFGPNCDNAETLLSIKQECALVEQALGDLPERQRTALLLKCEEQMSYEQIASVMDTSVSSVESLIFRARKKLLEIADVS